MIIATVYTDKSGIYLYRQLVLIEIKSAENSV